MKNLEQNTSETTTAGGGGRGTKRPWSKPSVRIMDAPHDRIYSIEGTGSGPHDCVTRGSFCHEDEFYNPVS